jgi:hypothetical protein
MLPLWITRRAGDWQVLVISTSAAGEHRGKPDSPSRPKATIMSKEDRLRKLMDAPPGEAYAERRLDLYKFHQERVETIRRRLWTTLTWLAAAQGAALIFAVKEGEIRSGRSIGLIGQPLLVIFVSLFGILLALYMLYVVKDGIKHIKSNWYWSDFAVGLQSGAEHVVSNPAFPAFSVMKVLAYMALVVHAVIVFLTIVGGVGWLGLDFSWLRLGTYDSSVGEPPPAQ